MEINFFNLMPGSYYIGLWTYTMWEPLDVLHNVAVLDVEPSDYYGTGRGVEPRFGLVFLPYRWGQGDTFDDGNPHDRAGNGQPLTDHDWKPDVPPILLPAGETLPLESE